MVVLAPRARATRPQQSPKFPYHFILAERGLGRAAKNTKGNFGVADFGELSFFTLTLEKAADILHLQTVRLYGVRGEIEIHKLGVLYV